MLHFVNKDIGKSPCPYGLIFIGNKTLSVDYLYHYHVVGTNQMFLISLKDWLGIVHLPGATKRSTKL